MKICCCGVVYSTEDYNTWRYFEKYKFIRPIKDFIKGESVREEIVMVLSCIKNNCTKLVISRYGQKDAEKILEKESMSGKAAICFLRDNIKNLIKIPLRAPYKKIYTAKRIPAVYCKMVDSQTQKRQYLDESGSPDNKLLRSPCVSKFIDDIEI